MRQRFGSVVNFFFGFAQNTFPPRDYINGGIMRRFILVALLGTIVGSNGAANAFCYEEAGAMYDIAPRILWTISKRAGLQMHSNAQPSLRLD
jgi:hypothetical protein